MFRHLLARRRRFGRPVRHPREGFTLVELLVVITIIAMLVGLLIPAVMRARENGRRAQCLNNNKEIGTAMTSYVTSKDRFPPLFSVQPQPTGTPVPLNPRVGWVPPMLTYLGQNPLYQAFQGNQWLNLQNAEVSTLICPSRNPTSTQAPLSYAVNAGISDYVRSAPPMPTDPPMDYEENGIFFDEYAPVLNPTRPKAPRIDMSYLSKHDGAQHTILCSENLDALDWIHLQAPPPAVLPKYIADEREPSYFQAIIWVMFEPPAPPSWGMAGSPPTGTVLNKYQTTFPSMPNWEEMDYGYGRPSSNHGGGFVVTFCDGHSQFMSEDIAYRVYCLLMSPNSQKARDPRYISYPSGSVYPANWYQTSTATAYGDPIVPLTDADLNN